MMKRICITGLQNASLVLGVDSAEFQRSAPLTSRTSRLLGDAVSHIHNRPGRIRREVGGAKDDDELDGSSFRVTCLRRMRAGRIHVTLPSSLRFFSFGGGG